MQPSDICATFCRFAFKYSYFLIVKNLELLWQFGQRSCVKYDWRVEQIGEYGKRGSRFVKAFGNGLLWSGIASFAVYTFSYFNVFFMKFGKI